MSLAYHRIKMRLTKVAVKNIRRVTDKCNSAIDMCVEPFRAINNRLSQEAPWLVSLMVVTFASAVPLVVYPYVKNFSTQGKRHELEEERVRMCLQKGIDPYPVMRHKDFVFGHHTIGQSKEGQFPTSASWEYQGILDFQREKEELRQQVGGNVEDSVQKLLALREKYDAKNVGKPRRPNAEPPGLMFPGREDSDKVNS